jgi:hypothetical protein
LIASVAALLDRYDPRKRQLHGHPGGRAERMRERA